jgi:opacity protein-like surface antigen
VITLRTFRPARHARPACIVALLSFGLAASAAAQQPPRDAYLGMGLGQFAYEVRSDGSTFLDTTVGAVKFYGGFRLSRRWSFEASYQISAPRSRPGLPESLEPGLPGVGQIPMLSSSTRLRLELATARLMRRFPFPWGQLFSGIGASGASVDTEVRLDGGNPVSAGFHISKNGLTVDAGVQWEFDAWSLRFEYEWWATDMQAAGLYMHWNL